MTKLALAAIALLATATTAQAHQIWIEQADGQNAVVRFGEFGENLREASPGLLDKFAKVTGTLVATKGEQKSDATKTAGGFTLPFKAATGDSIVAEDASYPLYQSKQQDKPITGWYYPRRASSRALLRRSRSSCSISSRPGRTANSSCSSRISPRPRPR